MEIKTASLTGGVATLSRHLTPGTQVQLKLQVGLRNLQATALMRDSRAQDMAFEIVDMNLDERSKYRRMLAGNLSYGSRFEIHRTDRCVGVQSDGGLLRKMSGERGGDVLREKHAASVDPEGPLDTCGVQLREALRQVREPELGHRLADLGQHRGRTRRPGLAIARERERSGGCIETLAEIGPQQVPSGIGIVDHPGIAALMAIGVTYETVFVHRGAERIGEGALTLAGRPPSPDP